MLRVISAVLALGLIVSAPAFAQSSVAGAWELTINGPEGPITATATLKQDGENVTGSIETPAGRGGNEGHL